MNDAELIESLMIVAKRKGVKKDRVVKISREGDVSVKLAPQAVKVLALLFDMGSDEVKESEIAVKFADADISKKQDPFRIYQYYRKSLVDAKWLELV